VILANSRSRRRSGPLTVLFFYQGQPKRDSYGRMQARHRSTLDRRSTASRSH
jgi:hypothetical protein